ncbi:DNA-binding protein [Micromonospora aurantiaca]|uniref:DNA-binding protein n=1 Tax=Micromonospora aurantiaca (nom. illeg.) TaxID=47850 RepID=A0A6N3JXX4_9ACTN|nr:DNA-binding protein [Micromonospora aurantiaca]
MTVEELLTMDEAARLLRVSRWTVFRLAKERQVTSLLVGQRCRRITASSVQAYIARQLEEAA